MIRARMHDRKKRHYYQIFQEVSYPESSLVFHGWMIIPDSKIIFIDKSGILKRQCMENPCEPTTKDDENILARSTS